MAIQKEKTLHNGAVGNYWKIVSVSTDKLTMQTEWVIALFKDKATSTATRAPLGAIKKFKFACTRDELAGDLTALGYAKIKAQVETMVTHDLRGQAITPIAFDTDLADGADV